MKQLESEAMIAVNPATEPPDQSSGGDQNTHVITIAGAPLAFACDENDVLGRAALRAGIDFPYECNMGGCGACKVQLVSGEVETVWPDAVGLTERDRRRGYRLACQSRPLSDCSITVRSLPTTTIPLEYRPRRRTAELRRRRILSPTMVELEFATADAARFLPGQYALLAVPGVVGKRAYSMANEANDSGLWTFIVRRVVGGAATSFLFDSLDCGDTVVLDAPYGRAYWQPRERRTICVAGGSGVAHR